MAENEKFVERNYKDTLFRQIFNDETKLLSLYNAVNSTNHQNPEDVRINTLENAVYMNVKNDVSCVLGFHMNLYEHQSTFNPNMPLRDLDYINRLWMGEIDRKSLYSPKLIRLPTPKFVVFYNGTSEQPEHQILKLSDAYLTHEGASDLELRVTMLNVNLGNNKELMEQCQTLKEYAIYVDKVRRYAKYMEISDAVDKAVNESIEEDVLREYLTKCRAEAIHTSIFEYDEEREMKLIREAYREIGLEEGREEGRKEGREEGRKEGREEGETKYLIAQICKKIDRKMTEDEIAVALEEDISKIKPIYDIACTYKDSEYDITEIYNKLHNPEP